MLKKLSHWTLWFGLVVLILVAFIPGLTIFHSRMSSAVHASGGDPTPNPSPTLSPTSDPSPTPSPSPMPGGGPSLSLSASIVIPNETITVTGQGFASQENVWFLFDDFNNYPIGSTSVDINGNFTTVVKLPGSAVLQGLHLLIASGQSDTAEAAITFVPHIFPTSGKPGLPVQLTGAAFTANETIQVYFGTASGQLLGTTTTNATGDLSFTLTVPASLAEGSYFITFVRTNQQPKIVTTKLLVKPAKIAANPGIHDGQLVTAHLTGFLSQESVTVSWNANGGQLLTVVQTNMLGAAIAQFAPPLTVAGTYILTAAGDTSKIQATTSMNIGPGILLNTNSYSNYGNPGGTIDVVGGGFTAGETIHVYFQTAANGIVTTTADSTGAFTVALTTPTTYNPYISYYVHALNSTGTEKGWARFYFEQPTLSTPSNSYFYTQPVSFYGTGFASNETIHLLWNYLQQGGSQIATVTADSYGSFSITVTPPSTPFPGPYQGTVTAAVGITSGLIATTSFIEFPFISLTPSTGKAGISVQVSGGDFGSSETVTVWYPGSNSVTATTNADGSFVTTFTLPVISGPGDQVVDVEGNTSGILTTAPFEYTRTLSITPTKGPSGTTITVTGQMFSANATVPIIWKDTTSPKNPKFITLATFYADSNGALSGTVTAPLNLKSGQKYFVLANDIYPHLWVQVPFVAQ